MPGFKLELLISFHSLIFSIEISENFLEMLHKVSPSFTSYVFSLFKEAVFISVFGFGTGFKTGLFGCIINLCPILILLFLNPFQRLISLTLTPYWEAILPK